jgi:hypothetical protein
MHTLKQISVIEVPGKAIANSINLESSIAVPGSLATVKGDVRELASLNQDAGPRSRRGHHSSPLPSGERGRVRGPRCRTGAGAHEIDRAEKERSPS